MIEPQSVDGWIWTESKSKPTTLAAAVLPPPVPETEDVTTSQWLEAHVSFEKGSYQEALESYQSILALRPQHRASWFNVAACLERLGRHSEAESAYRRVPDGSPAAPEVSLCLGQILFRLGKYDEAITHFAESLAGNLGSTPALVGKAMCLHKLGRLNEATACYAAVPASYEYYSAVLVNRIAIAAARNDRPQLLQSGEELVKLKKQSAAALSALMQAKVAVLDYKAATQHGLRLVKAEPRSFEAWFNLGLCYQMTHHPEQAAQAYTEAIQINVQAAPAHFNMGVILQEQAELSTATREFERVLEIQPDHVLAKWSLAGIHEKDGRPERAEQIYSQLIHDGQRVFMAGFRLGLLRLEQGNHQGAIEAFRLCLGECSDNTSAQINLSVAQWRSGDREAAEAGIQRALAQDPDSVAGLALSGTLAIEAADWRKASEVESRLTELGQATAMLAYNVGVLQQEQGLHEEAARSFRRASDQKPGFVEALVNAGKALKAAGQTEAAADMWKAALEADPETAQNYFKTRTALMAV